jgi:hypothetical protein
MRWLWHASPHTSWAVLTCGARIVHSTGAAQCELAFQTQPCASAMAFHCENQPPEPAP